MSLLIEIALKTTAIVLLALITVSMLRRRSAAARHFVLVSAFAGALVVPILTMVAPAWRVPVPAAWLAVGGPSAMTISSNPTTPSANVIARPARIAASPGRPRAAAPVVLAAIWLSGAAVGIAIMCAGIWRVRRLASRAHRIDRGVWRDSADDIASGYGIGSHVDLLLSAHPTMLVTWGALRPRILLPSTALDWTDERIRVVLYHELAHVQRRDWMLLITASIIRALHWFNPLIWVACRRLRQEGEQAADDLVLARGITGPDYASHLLAVARESVRHRHTWSTATAIAHPSTLEGRIRAMLNNGLNRTPPTGIGRLMTGAATLIATLLVAGAGISTFAASVPVADGAPVPGRARVDAADPVVDRTEPAQTEGRAPVPATDATRIALRMLAQRTAAQSGPGSITGVLYDQLGGLLPGANVTLVQRPDGAAYRTDSDRNGSFAFTLLPAGDYELTTSLPGFATVTNLVKVSAGQTIDRAVTLPMGTLRETISVVDDGRVHTPVPTGYPRRERARATTEPRTFFSGGIGGQIRVPVKTLHVSPVFPPNLQNASGIVLLEARVGIDGYLSDIRDVTGSRSSAAHQAFLASALDAVRQWEFRPVLLNNVPVEANIAITIDYSSR